MRLSIVDGVAWGIVAVVALAIGAAVGGVLSFVHGMYPPWCLIAALAVVAALLAGMRLALQTRVAPIAAAVGILAASIAFAIPNGSGTIIIAADLLGYLWLILPAAIAVAVVVWPNPKRGYEGPARRGNAHQAADKIGL